MRAAEAETTEKYSVIRQPYNYLDWNHFLGKKKGVTCLLCEEQAGN